MIGISILRASVLMVLVTQSQAATLEFQGDAAVDNGSGFSPALHNMLLSGGDRVRAIKGCAKILYDNGYCAKVCDGRMAVVYSTPPEPVRGSAVKDASAPPRHVVNVSLNHTPAEVPTSPGLAGGGSLKDAPVLVAAPQTPDSNWLAAGLAAAAGGGTVIAIASGGESRAASPVSQTPGGGTGIAIANSGGESRAASP